MLQNQEQEPGHDKREIDHAHRAHDAAYRFDERVGDVGKEADKGVALIEAKPLCDRALQHCQDDYSNAILHKDANDRIRRCI